MCACSAPAGPSWDTATPAADWSAAGIAPGMEGACGSLWRWLGGDGAAGPAGGATDTTVAGLGARLAAEHSHGDEPGRHSAGYQLAVLAASGGSDASQAVKLLLAAL